MRYIEKVAESMHPLPSDWKLARRIAKYLEVDKDFKFRLKQKEIPGIATVEPTIKSDADFAGNEAD